MKGRSVKVALTILEGGDDYLLKRKKKNTAVQDGKSHGGNITKENTIAFIQVPPDAGIP